MPDPVPQPGAQPPGQPPAPVAPPPAPPAGLTLEGMTSEKLQELYKNSPDLFKGLVPAVPPAPPAPPPPAPSAGDDLKLELPKDAQVDQKVIDRFKERWSKTAPEKRAQEVVNFYLELNKEAQASNRASFDEWRKKNEELLKADPDWRDFEAAKAVAQRPLAKYATPELAKALAESGWENHPEMAKFLHKIGKAMGEDSTRRPPPVSAEATAQAQEYGRRYDHPSSRGMSGMPPAPTE